MFFRPTLIAEVKTKSPFGYESGKSWEELFEIASEYGGWVSVHTDPAWGGSFENVAKAKDMTNKPVLAKGIHETDEDIEKALSVGADYVLTVRERPPEIEGQENWLLYEPYGLVGLSLAGSGLRRVWNARDLRRGGEPKPTGFAIARAMAPTGWLCQASLISDRSDVHPQADAVLVGQNLEKFVASL
jgi:hypothetical protein